MNYLLQFMKQVEGRENNKYPNFLVSGSDLILTKGMFRRIVEQESLLKKRVIVIDDSAYSSQYLGAISDMSMNLKNGLSGKYSLSNPLKIGTLLGISRLRELFEIVGYSELQKQKTQSYLLLVKHLENLRGNEISDLNLNVLTRYSSNITVEYILQSLLYEGIIDKDEQIYLLSRYAEVSSAVADLDNLLLMISPFIKGEKIFMDKEKESEIIYFNLGDANNDIVMKKILLNFIAWEIADSKDNCAVVLLEQAKKGENIFLEFIYEIPVQKDLYYFSDDIFHSEEKEIEYLQTKFPMKIYCRHEDISSCEKLKKYLGNVDVVKKQYTIDRDRRIKMNTPWDILFDRNKVEHYTTNAPVSEAKYKKEYIATLPELYAIVEYRGENMVCRIGGV